MTEENTQLTVEDILSEAENAAYHSVLEIWRSVLAPIRTERMKRITPQWANRIVGSYNGILFSDMAAFRDRYYDRLEELLQILEVSIDDDIECLRVQSAEEDVENNGLRYKVLLLDWQKAFLLWELEWDSTEYEAAIDLAVISEIHKMIFGEQGIISLLDQIKFTFTDDDRADLAGELEEMRKAHEVQGEQ